MPIPTALRAKRGWRHFAGVTLLATILGVAIGCTDATSSTVPAATVAGAWAGTITYNATHTVDSLRMTLIETNGTVSGNGTYRPANAPTVAPAVLTITGVVSGSTVSLTLSGSLTGPANLTATLDGLAMNGALQGGGFHGDSVAIRKGQ